MFSKYKDALVVRISHRTHFSRENDEEITERSPGQALLQHATVKCGALAAMPARQLRQTWD